MIGFYYLPGNLVTLISFFSWLAVTIQAVALILRTYSLDRRRKNLDLVGLEAAILYQLLLLAMLLARMQFGSQYGFVYSSGYVAWRYLALGLVIAAGLSAALIKKQPKRLLSPLAAFLVCPLMEEWFPNAFVWLFGLALTFFLVRGILVCLRRVRELQNDLTLLSVKEAIDALPTGILFFRQNGRILMRNACMLDLVQTLTGAHAYNGQRVWKQLQGGQVLPGCKCLEIAERLTYRLPDGSVWEFASSSITDRGRRCTLITAANMTSLWDAVQELLRQNELLHRREAELKQTVENLDSICRQEELLRAKTRFHDVLGQRISLLLRSLREQQAPDEEILAPFAHGFPEELTRDLEVAPEETLEQMAAVYHSLGVEVQIIGSLPVSRPLAKDFTEMIAECASNAVRHGYATSVWVELSRKDDAWMLLVTDNGIPPREAITEGGGITGIRRRAERYGGTVEVLARTRFTVRVTIQEGDAP